MKKFLAIALALVMICSLSVTAFAAEKTYTISIGHSDTTQNLIHISLEHFAKAVEERTEGRVKVQIFAAEQLGSNAEMIEMVEMGNLDAMMLPSGQQASFCPKFAALSLPFLFADYDHVYKVLDGEIGQELLEGLEDHNMIQLAYWENGLRQFTNSKRAIEKPDDLKGLKFRTPEDKMTMAIFAAYGASASPFAFSELYLALQQGTFDGQENPVSNIYANNFQDVQKYLTMVNYQYQPKSPPTCRRSFSTAPRSSVLSTARPSVTTRPPTWPSWKPPVWKSAIPTPLRSLSRHRVSTPTSMQRTTGPKIWSPASTNSSNLPGRQNP